MSNILKHTIDIENSESYGSDDSSSEKNYKNRLLYNENDYLTDSFNDNSECELSEYSDDNSGEQYKFFNEWEFWYHHENKNWFIDGYKKIFTIKNIKDYWDLHNNIDKIGGINNQHFFLMRKGIEPIWEHSKNKNGGCWSIKLSVDKAYSVWEKLSIYILGETLIKDTLSINGLSICLKNPMTSVIKIWNNNSNNNSANQLPDDILQEYSLNVLYKAHICEY